MSYREKPQLKLYKYENNSFILQAIIDDYQECSFEDNLYEAGQFSITINFNIPNSQLFQRGLFIQFGSSWKFGEITKIQDQIGEEGKGSQYRIITGFDARYILKRRVIKNMNSNGLWVMTGKGEIVLRNLINDQAGTNAEEKRRLPITNTIPDSETAIGKEYSASEQFSNLYEVCKTIATQSEIGWRVEFDGTNLTLVCFNGTDRTQTVQFSTSFDSLANGQFIDSSESFSNAIYVGGKGQNDNRDIYEGESAIEGDSPSGLDRFESWDNQSSMTTESEYEAEALSMLNQYGQTLTMSGNGLAKCPYEYEKEYFTGDKIKIAFSGKSANAQILSVTEHWAFGAYEINFSFGKPLPDLNAQLQLMLRKIQTASNKTNSKDSVRWYTIPTDTAMPASDVTYTHIGFIGNVGEGATFTLYRDSSGTGSKTYHVYIKQLAGSGKLTLTTGVSGASNLLLNPGTYVAIIYVDENGNITSQGMTATALIETGNNQPVESGAVADEISNLTEIASSLPTDAVLHYSFDDVPDYPDGTATYRKDNDFTTTSDWVLPADITATLVNNCIKLQSDGTRERLFAKNDIFTTNNLKGKIVIVKFTSSFSVSRVGFQVQVSPWPWYWLEKIKQSGNEYLYVGVLPSDMLSGSPYIAFESSSASADNAITISAMYIGDGSYSTPIIDNAGNGINASGNGVLTSKGMSGKCALFVAGSRRKIINSPTFLNDINEWTISFWVNLNEGVQGSGTNPRLYQFAGLECCFINNFYKGYTGDRRFTLYTYIDQDHRLQITGISITNYIGKWVHFAVTTKINLNGTSSKYLYINGVQVGGNSTDTITSKPIVVNGYIGGTTSSDQYLENSMIDDFQIFDRALSDTEVQALYQNKANTPKYFPTPTNEIKEGSLELATSGGVFNALENKADINIIYDTSITNCNNAYQKGKTVTYFINSTSSNIPNTNNSWYVLSQCNPDNLSANNYVTQIATPSSDVNANTVYTRHAYISNSVMTWTPWVRLINERDKYYYVNSSAVQGINWYKIAKFGQRNRGSVISIDLFSVYFNQEQATHKIQINTGYNSANVMDFAKDLIKVYDKIRICYNSNNTDHMAIYVHYAKSARNDTYFNINAGTNNLTTYNFVTDELTWDNTIEYNLGTDGLYLNGVLDNPSQKQDTTLSTPITIGGQSYTTVESALQALAGLV